MAWRRPGDKPLSEPTMVNSMTHICVTRPHRVNHNRCITPEHLNFSGLQEVLEILQVECRTRNSQLSNVNEAGANLQARIFDTVLYFCRIVGVRWNKNSPTEACFVYFRDVLCTVADLEPCHSRFFHSQLKLDRNFDLLLSIGDRYKILHMLLSWHVQIFVATRCPKIKIKQYLFSIGLRLRVKIISVMSPWIQCPKKKPVDG